MRQLQMADAEPLRERSDVVTLYHGTKNTKWNYLEEV